MSYSTALRVGLIWALACGCLAAVAAENAPAPSRIENANQKLGRGINLGNALDAPNEGEWGVTLKPGYFKVIRAAGFDTVRLPARWSAHAAKEAPFTIEPNFARRMDWAIEQAIDNRLNIIVNVHHYMEMDDEPDRHLRRLIDIWEQIAERYKDKPDSVYFELLNEPHGKLNEDKWNAAVPALLASVRKTNPDRPVILGPALWNAIRALDKLKLPKDDRNLIVTVHYYEPFEFTHQGAPFQKGADKWKGRKWTGSEAEQAAVRKNFQKAATWAKQHALPVFLGEFGTFHEADMASRARWTRFIVREAEKLGFSWAYWEFCSGFGAFDPEAEQWRQPLKMALLDQ
jgi:endoglucanase